MKDSFIQHYFADIEVAHKVIKKSHKIETYSYNISIDTIYFRFLIFDIVFYYIYCYHAQ